jgi:hypothetical protein
MGGSSYHPCLHLNPPPWVPACAGAKPDLLTRLGSRSRYNRCLYMGLCFFVCLVLLLGIWASGDDPLVATLNK